MKWLVLGANGQLGHAMVDYLRPLGESITALKREDLDVTDAERVKVVFQKIRPDVIVNAAAWTQVDEAEQNIRSAMEVNAFAPGILATESRSIEAQFVHISTDYVFSGPASTPWSEDALPCPSSVYGDSKARGEKLVSAIALQNSFIVRTAWLYSPWGKNFVKTMLAYALNKSATVSVVNDQLGQPTSAMDLARQIHLLINSGGKPGVYHATNSGQATWFEFAKEIFVGVGADPERVMPIKGSEYSRPAERPSYSVLGHDRWEEQGIKSMRNWQAGLHEALPSIIQTMNRAG